MRALFSFFTVLPLGRGATLEEAARSSYGLPLVGISTGLPGAALILLGVFPPGVAASLALVAALLAAGLHHTDGVLDVGDALMVRGTPARRREVLKDARVGVGGLGALFAVYAPTLAALSSLAEESPYLAALSLLAAEVGARSAMLLVLAFGRPASGGSSSAYFVRALKGGRRAVAIAISLVLPAFVALPLGWGALAAALLAAPAVALSALRVSGQAFGGISGDVSGATGELARAVLLVALSAVVTAGPAA
ncbi:adenosylcobinamide-GDP ribazoletransferase [Rubrobacter marinus]|uniref:adenosylcobinamide-GDP ribazoletransferase n=1 Tax=Rubrobacter marinus TaxID=2653852 RepID=UPI00140E808F|nr:adenosylcobinamide-GDP ribazoletransferase [Rubrobacter marinus]